MNVNHAQGRAHGAFTCRRPARLAAVECRAQLRPQGDHEDRQCAASFKHAGAGAAAAICIASLVVASPLPALASDIYQQRAEAMQRRKDLMQQTREKALAKGGVESPSEAAPAPAGDSPPEVIGSSPANTEAPPAQLAPEQASTTESDAQRERQSAAFRDSFKQSRKNYEEESAKDASKLKPAPEAEKNPSWFKGFLNRGSEEKAPAPQEQGAAAKFIPQDAQDSLNAPAVPAPPSREPVTPKKQPEKADVKPGKVAASRVDPLAPESPVAKQEEKYTSKPSAPQAAAKKEESKKRRGPLPMWLAQVLLLGSFGGTGYLVFFKEQELNKVLAAGAKGAVSVYNKVENKITSNN